MQKSTSFKIKGINRDLSPSTFNQDYAYDAKNIRITSLDGNTLLSITNEKGNKKINIKGDSIVGTPIGSVSIDNTLVLFSHIDYLNPIIDNINSTSSEVTNISSSLLEDSDYINIPDIFSSNDYIYKITKENKEWNSELLYSGNLNFSLNNPIEAICNYDNFNNRKVYWVDGINQPRVINIDTLRVDRNWNSKSFDFSSQIDLTEAVSISKKYDTHGAFPSGVIQYYFTYISSNGQESSIFYSSPLYYISNKDRAGSPEEYINCAFSIEAKNLSKNAEYLRIYSSIRTSLNDTLITKKLVDIKIQNHPSSGDLISYIDLGNQGELIDSSDLFFKGGDTIIASSINSKDSTLFLGNIKEINTKLDDNLKTLIQTNLQYNITGGEKSVIIAETEEGFYPSKNLSEVSTETKVFKAGEWYRFGIQLQDKYGKWSEPIYLNDIQNPVYPKSEKLKDIYVKVWMPSLTLTDEVKKSLLIAGYKKVRPVVVYPTEQERTVICQGVLNPTVFNVGNRKNNSPSSIASWFFRPNVPFDINTYNNPESWITPIVGDAEEIINSKANTLKGGEGDGYIYSESKGALVKPQLSWNDIDVKSMSTETKPGINIYNQTDYSFLFRDFHSLGTYSEFRHMAPIPGNRDTESRQVEIQGAASFNSSYEKSEDSVFGIDSSIFTLNSPEITEDFNKLLGGYNLRVIGVIPITTSSSDIILNTSNSNMVSPKSYFYYYGSGTLGSDIAKSSDIPYGKYINKIIPVSKKFNVSAFKSLITQPMYLDGWYEVTKLNTDFQKNNFHTYAGFLFNVYPWQKQGSINNATTGDNLPSTIEKKILANTKVSYNNYYLDSQTIETINEFYVGSDIKVFKDGIERFSDNTTYYGNYEEIIVSSEEYNISGASLNSFKYVDKNGEIYLTYNTPVNANIERYFPVTNLTNIIQKYSDKFESPNSLPNLNLIEENKGNIQLKTVGPTEIKFSSTPHLVINTPIIGDGEDREKSILPTLVERVGETVIGNIRGVGTKYYYPSNTDFSISTIQNLKYIDFSSWTDLACDAIGYGYLWLGELYREVEESILFGGKTPSAIENNLWVPCGEAINIDSYDTTIAWEEGDTYYQRYDCLKTYPTTENDTNSIVEVLSFMCESRINLEGRYDKNKGNTSNLHIRPSNFNLINPVYSQEDNLFSYRIINDDRKLTTNVPNGIIWSLPKVTGDLADTWTSLSTTNLIELDPKLGKVTAIKSYRDDLIAVQPKGLSRVLYNNRVQIPVSEGVPIQISNSGKVEGVQYISKFTGSSNKWSVIETEAGIYFVDDLNKDIFLLSDSLKNLSDSLGVATWVNQLESNKSWDLTMVNYDSKSAIRTLYDSVTKDVYFTLGKETLGYNELTNSFVSFYDYYKASFMNNILGDTISIGSQEDNYYLWNQHAGEYNSFFGETKPFWITYLVNPEPQLDKTFNILEFRADTFNDSSLTDTDFNILEVWNEYQSNEVNITRELHRPSNLKQKFRMWRALIPRDKSNGRDRMRNPWLYVKLKSDNSNNNKTVLHDTQIHYF